MIWTALIIGGVLAATAVVVAYMADKQARTRRAEILSTPPDKPMLTDIELPTYILPSDVYGL